MIQLRPMRYILAIFSIAIVLTELTGCAGTLFSYRGKVVAEPKNRFAFKEGDQQAIWDTGDLALNYRYQKSADSLKISGTVELSSGMLTNFSTAKYLDINLLFLDKQGTVIQNMLLFSAGDHYEFTSVRPSFEQTIPVPDGSDSFSFAYNGVLMDGKTMSTEEFTVGYFPK